MKKLLIILLFLPFLGCNKVINNKQTAIDFNCPQVFISIEDKNFIDNRKLTDEVLIKAELNNFAINKKCQIKGEIAIIPLDILIIAKPLDDLQNPKINIPVYISLLDQNNNILETQYFLVSGIIKKNSETNKYIESDLTDRLEVITKYTEASYAVIGFMLDDKKRKLLN